MNKDIINKGWFKLQNGIAFLQQYQKHKENEAVLYKLSEISK